MLALLDALLFSGFWVALAAPALVAAVTSAFGGTPAPIALVYAFAGTFAVYGLDRLRDRASDGDSAPLRTAFVERNRRVLLAATAGAGAIAAVCAFALGPRAVALSVVAAGVGALHRKLKRRIPVKALYIAAIWLLVVLGAASLTAPPPPRASLGWAAALLGTALFANAISFTARDREGIVARVGRRQAMAAAVVWSAIGTLLAIAAPRELRALGAIPLATLLTLVRFRWDERYAPLVVDGALIAGALVACAAA